MSAAERIARAVDLVRDGASIEQAHAATRVTSDVIRRACKAAGVAFVNAKPIFGAPPVRDALCARLPLSLRTASRNELRQSFAKEVALARGNYAGSNRGTLDRDRFEALIGARAMIKD